MKTDSRMIAALIRNEITKQFPERSLKSLNDEWGLPDGTVGRISNVHSNSTGGMGVALLPKIVEHLPKLKPWLSSNEDQPGRRLVKLTAEGDHAFRLLHEKEKNDTVTTQKSAVKAAKPKVAAQAKTATKPTAKPKQATKPKSKPRSKSKPAKTIVVERNMPIEVIAKLVQIAKNPKALDQWINLASHIEDAGYKVSTLLRAIRNQVD